MREPAFVPPQVENGPAQTEALVDAFFGWRASLSESFFSLYFTYGSGSGARAGDPAR
jgi:hypothetical protein